MKKPIKFKAHVAPGESFAGRTKSTVLGLQHALERACGVMPKFSLVLTESWQFAARLTMPETSVLHTGYRHYEGCSLRDPDHAVQVLAARVSEDLRQQAEHAERAARQAAAVPALRKRSGRKPAAP